MGTSPLFYDTFTSPLGLLYLTFSGRHLCRIAFEKPPQTPYRKGAAPRSFLDELRAYFSGTEVIFRQKIRLLTGTDFERSVWYALKDIPSGETRTYKWLAEQVGRPAAVRAVGRALSKNPLPVVLPCHRVIESDGSLGGYSSGVRRKRRLLDLEHYGRMKTP